MSFEMSCSGCHAVVRAQIPAISKEGWWVGNCECGAALVTFYGVEHGMTKLVKDGKDGVERVKSREDKDE